MNEMYYDIKAAELFGSLAKKREWEILKSACARFFPNKQTTDLNKQEIL